MDERNTYFDEGVRRILSEPEEMLPEGLWNRIEARLDADAAGQAVQTADGGASRETAGAAALAADGEAFQETAGTTLMTAGQATDGGAYRGVSGRKRAVMFRRSAVAVLSAAAAAALAFVLFDISVPNPVVKPDGGLLSENTGTGIAAEADATIGITAENKAGSAYEAGAAIGSFAGTGIQVETEAGAGTGVSAGQSAGQEDATGGGNGVLVADASSPASGGSARSADPCSDRTAAKKRAETNAEGCKSGMEPYGRKNGEDSDERENGADSEGREEVLTVDDSDIEAVYGKEKKAGKRRRTPFSLTVGANSGAGPQQNASPVMMLSRGDRAPSGTTVVENAYPESYDLPLSFGIGIRFRLTKWLSIGTGVNYTLLGKKIGGTYYEIDDSGNKVLELETSLHNRQHYIGIPLDLYFSAFRNRRWDIYGTVGGSVEKCLDNRYEGSREGRSISVSKKVNGVQTAVKVGFGVEYSPLDFLGIYIDPSVRYYFDNGQPQSIRTAQPLAFTVEAGLRFNL